MKHLQVQLLVGYTTRLCMSPLHVSISTDPLASFVMYMLSHSSR